MTFRTEVECLKAELDTFRTRANLENFQEKLQEGQMALSTSRSVLKELRKHLPASTHYDIDLALRIIDAADGPRKRPQSSQGMNPIP